MYTSVLVACFVMCVCVASAQVKSSTVINSSSSPTTNTTTQPTVGGGPVSGVGGGSVSGVSVGSVSGVSAGPVSGVSVGSLSGVSGATLSNNGTHADNSASPLPVPAILTMLSLVCVMLYGINAQF